MNKTCWETLAELRESSDDRCANEACDYQFERTCSGCAILEREKFISNRCSGANTVHDKSSYFQLLDGSYITLNEGMTGSELANMLGFTRAYVSQITKKSLKRLRDGVEDQL